MSRPASTCRRGRLSRGAARSLRAVLVGLIAVAPGACGEGDQPVRSLRVDAADDESLRFDRSTVHTTSGRTSIEMANPSAIPHAIGIRGHGIDAAGQSVSQDGTSRVEADLEPGTYQLFCPVAGHEQAGMTATLVVR